MDEFLKLMWEPIISYVLCRFFKNYGYEGEAHKQMTLYLLLLVIHFIHILKAQNRIYYYK